jgi:glutathione S-transferase
MRLYDGGRAPNPRRVRIFLAEKGVTVETVPVDIGQMEHRAPAYAAVNPWGQVPALELDDGAVLTETIAICRYFEETIPTPPLFGLGARERAEVEMWQRRLELRLMTGVQHAFRHLHPAMAPMEVPQVPEWGEANKPRVREALALLDAHLADGRPYVCGEAYSVADITGLVAIDFMKPAKLTVPDEFAAVRRWHAAVTARPSAKA